MGSGSVATTQNLFSVGVNYSVALFTGFAQTKNVEIQELGKKQSEISLNLTTQQIIYNTKSLYLSLLSLNEQLKATLKYSNAQKKFLNIIHNEVKLEKKAYIDELKAKNDLQTSKTKEQILRSNITAVKASIKYFINQDIDQVDAIDIEVKRVDATTDKLDSLNRIEMLNLAIKSDQKKIDIKKSFNYPQISLNGFYGQNFAQNDATNINSGDWENKEVWQIGLKIKYNLFDFGAKEASIQASRVQKLQNKIKKEDIKKEILKEITIALSKTDESISNYKNELSKYELLTQTAEIEKVRYESGFVTINDLLFVNAQREIAKSKMIDAKYNYQKSIYYIEYILEQGKKQ